MNINSGEFLTTQEVAMQTHANPDVPRRQPKEPCPYTKDAFTSAIYASDLDPISKAMLGALAHRFANWQTGGDCWPADETLAAAVGCKVRSIRERRNRLKEIWFTLSKRPGETYRYQLKVPVTPAPRAAPPLHLVQHPPAPDAAPPLQDMQVPPAPDAAYLYQEQSHKNLEQRRANESEFEDEVKEGERAHHFAKALHGWLEKTYTEFHRIDDLTALVEPLLDAHKGETRELARMVKDAIRTKRLGARNAQRAVGWALNDLTQSLKEPAQISSVVPGGWKGHKPAQAMPVTQAWLDKMEMMKESERRWRENQAKATQSVEVAS